MQFYVFTDAAFVGLASILFIGMRLRWLLILASLYATNVMLDVLLIQHYIEYVTFAWSSNILFVAELILASHVGMWRTLQSCFSKKIAM